MLGIFYLTKFKAYDNAALKLKKIFSIKIPIWD